MQKHTKIYINHFPSHTGHYNCEVCGNTAVDIHHIEPRSKFGKKTKGDQDRIENLIALCRSCHDDAHAEILSKEELTERHNKKLGK
ncbi:HNH endonuclease [Algoriella sp.]|uniref:HNH endonuclease n=1 Tax=Algoriella sp. TaxID=1872434 RepID=UPI002FC8AF10